MAHVIDKLTDRLDIQNYSLVMQDYGGPIGFRLALAHPERIRGMVVQNAAAHSAALGPLWQARRDFWRDPSAHEQALRNNFTSFDATRLRHVGRSPNPERYDPDAWTDEFAFLSRPGQPEIQLALFYDYRTNVAAYPRWQNWLTRHQPPLLVIWGRYDPSFEVAGAMAYREAVPSAEIHLLDAGHFALDESPEEVTVLIQAFLDRLYAV